MKKAITISMVSFVAIGLVFGRFIGRYLINKIDDPDTSINDGRAYADKYITKCDTINLILKDFKIASVSFETKSGASSWSDDQVASIRRNSVSFYSDLYKKYFNILYFFQTNSDWGFYYNTITSKMRQSGEHIIGVINKNELRDPTYGTIQKPIPILYFTFEDKTRRTVYDVVQQGGKEFKGDENQFRSWMLHHNVLYYLSNVKSKADFENMFGKQK